MMVEQNQEELQGNWVSKWMARLLGIAGLCYAATVMTITAITWSGVFVVVWGLFTYWVIENSDDMPASIKNNPLGSALLVSLLTLGWVWAVIGFFRYMF